MILSYSPCRWLYSSVKPLLLLSFLLLSFLSSAQDYTKTKVERSDYIIEGKIVEQIGIYNQSKTRVYTKNTIEISKILKGQISESQISIITLGGKIDDFSYEVFHTESLHQEQEGIFFLKNIPNTRQVEIGDLPDNSFFLSGNNFTIHFTKDIRIPAYSSYKDYLSLEEVYEDIRHHSQIKPISIIPNSLEKRVVQNQLLLSGNTNAVVEYRFQEVLYDYPKLNINISALSNLTDIYFAGGELVFKYDSESLGEYLVANQKIKVLPNPLLKEETYFLNYSDIDKETIKIEIGLNDKSNLFPLSPLERSIIDLELDISSLISVGSLSMDAFQMSGKSYYIEEGSKDIEIFDEIIVPNEISVNNGCFSFFPEELNAGVGDILTITAEDGLDFGTIKGAVFLGDANDHFRLNEVNSHHVTWTPSEIQVVIPYITEFERNPGSGDIEVLYYDIEGEAQTIKSKTPLQICYSINNDVCFGIVEDEIHDVYNDNGMGGYTFFLGSQLDEVDMAREIIEDAICKWGDETGINFELSDVVIPNPSPNPDPTKPPIPLSVQNDDQNIIFLGGENEGLTPDSETGNLPSAEVGVGMVSYNPNASECALKRWLVDIDIIVNKDVLFHYSLSEDDVPDDKVDFSSVMIHELGHAHSHGHATLPWNGVQSEQTKTMYYALPKGWKKRYIDEECAVSGSEFVFNHSQELEIVSSMEMGGCIIDATENVEEVNTKFLEISPNPFYSNFEIQVPNKNEIQFVDVEIYSLAGQLLWAKRIFKESNGFKCFPPENLSSGVYILKGEIRNEIYSSKLIKIQ